MAGFGGVPAFFLGEFRGIIAIAIISGRGSDK
jgi:hypothetical protein